MPADTPAWVVLQHAGGTDRRRPRVLLSMRLVALLVAAVAFTSLGLASSGRAISANGVRVVVPPRWHRVHPAGDGPVVDPRTLLVVGTVGVRARSSQCQVAAYRVPASGAAVVVVGWKRATSGGGHMKPGRTP